MMAEDYAFEDARRPLTIHVTQADIDGAEPGSARNCVLARAARREHGSFDIQVHRTVAYVRKRESSVPLRYQINESTKDVLMTFDASGRARPVTVTFMPPRWGLSIDRLRSDEVRRAAKRTRDALKKKRAEGDRGKRRAYTKPDPLTLIGVRNGRGARPPGRGRI